MRLILGGFLQRREFAATFSGEAWSAPGSFPRTPVFGVYKLTSATKAANIKAVES
jgi:hypothetical protein